MSSRENHACTGFRPRARDGSPRRYRSELRSSGAELRVQDCKDDIRFVEHLLVDRRLSRPSETPRSHRQARSTTPSRSARTLFQWCRADSVASRSLLASSGDAMNTFSVVLASGTERDYRWTLPPSRSVQSRTRPPARRPRSRGARSPPPATGRARQARAPGLGEGRTRRAPAPRRARCRVPSRSARGHATPA